MNQNRLTHIFIIIFCAVCLCGFGFGKSLPAKTREANDLYVAGDFDEALKRYRDAQVDDPTSGVLHYNIANSLHQQKKYDEAVTEYEHALGGEDILLESQIYYNRGNSLYRSNDLPGAIEAYKKCLDINPDDQDAKYNIEFIRRKIKENAQRQEQKNQQQQQQQQQGQQGQQDQQQQSSGSSPQPEDVQQQPRSGDEESETDNAAGADGKGEEENEPSSGKEGEQSDQASGDTSAAEQRAQATDEDAEGKEGAMSTEDAERILEALQQKEKDELKNLKHIPSRGRARVEKDW